MLAGAVLVGPRRERIPGPERATPGHSLRLGWSALLLAAGLVLLAGGCRDASAPETRAEVILGVVNVEGPTFESAGPRRVSLSCNVLLRATARGSGAATWQGGTLLFYAGRDRSEPLDTLPISAEDAAAIWQSSELEPGMTLFGRFILTSSVPFAVTAVFEYRPSPRAAPRTAEASFACGPTVPEGAAGPAITAATVHPSSGVVEPGQTIRIDYSATSEVGLVEAVVEVSGACQASDTVGIRLEKAVTQSMYIQLPRSCIVGEALNVAVMVFDGALEAAFRAGLAAPTVGDLTPPSITPSFVPRANPNGTANPEADYFVGDTLQVYFNAVDNIGIAALVWEVLPAGIRDSIPIASATNPIRIPIDARWGAEPVRLRLYAWDRAGRMSNVYTSPHDIRVHPTVVRPFRWGGVSGGIGPLAIDGERGIAYILQADLLRLAIFSFETMSVTGHVDLGARPSDIDITPSGDSLIVAMPAQRALGIIDLRGPTPVVSTLPITVLDTVIKDVPVRVRVLGAGRVLVGLEGTAQASTRIAEVNLGSKTQHLLPEPPFAGGRVFERSHDRSAVVFRGREDHLQRYDAISDQFGPARAAPPMWFETRPSVDLRGERIALGTHVFDRDLTLLSRAVQLPNSAYWAAAISPSGEVLYVSSRLEGIIRFRASDGSIIDRTPNFAQGVIHVTGDGRWVVTHGNDIISVTDMR